MNSRGVIKYDLQIYLKENSMFRNRHSNARHYVPLFQIREIVFTDDGYNPTLTGQFSNDIVAIVLKRKVQLNKFVLPACIDWTSSEQGGSQLPEGTPGKVSTYMSSPRYPSNIYREYYFVLACWLGC